jgi:hypothetical protein
MPGIHDWKKGDPVTVKSWTITPTHGVVDDVEPDGTVIVKLETGGHLIWVDPLRLIPRKKS